MSANHHLDLPSDVLLAVLHSHGRRISRLFSYEQWRRGLVMTKKKEIFLRFPPRWCESRWLMYDERSSWVLACLPVCSSVCVYVSEEKNSERKKSHFGFSSCYPFYHLVAIFMAEFYLPSEERRRESIFGVILPEASCVWVPEVWQRWWIASRRREFILFYLFSTLSGRNKKPSL